MAGSLAKSTEVMQAMQRLVRVPEVAQTMQDMSKEMMKAGIIEEMLDETFEDMEDQDELEDAAQVEVIGESCLRLPSCTGPKRPVKKLNKPTCCKRETLEMQQ